jgi:uncharacterized sulfatase
MTRTPNVDTLAEKGVKFSNAFVTGPVCSPSRTALAVGMYQTSIGAFNMRYPDSLKPSLPDSVKTMEKILQKHGYVTANIKDKPSDGKIDWQFKYDTTSQFNYTHWEQLKKQNKPFFAYVNIGNTHRPFPRGSRNPRYLKKIRAKIPPYYPKNIVSEEDWADYYQSINILDKKVGKVLSTLKRNHWSNNTIVFFFSDHGVGMIRAKMFLYDSGIQIPLIIYIPKGVSTPKGYQAGKTDKQLISEIDITATTLHLADIPKTAFKFMQGRVFWGESPDPKREYTFSATDRIGETFEKSRSVRSDSFKYIRNFHHNFSVNSASTYWRQAHQPIYHLLNILHERNELTPVQKQVVEPLPAEELYDIQNDPYEIHNLANDPKYRLKLVHMQKVLDEWIIRSKDQGMGPDSPAIQKVFKEYGEQSKRKHIKKIYQLHKLVLQKLNEDDGK